MQRFLKAKQFAVVGASTNPDKFGSRIVAWFAVCSDGR
jgi:predicted CoA-binding protein